MATVKSETDLNQSRRLAEVLPIESADRWWNFYSVTTDDTTPQIIHLNTPWVGNFNWDNKPDNVPCWSLAALLDVLPTIDDRNAIFCKDIRYDKWHVFYHGTATLPLIDTERYPDVIDACVEMIIKLHELKLL